MTEPVDFGWSELIGESVVLDLASPYVYLGRLVAELPDCLVLEDVDAHDLRDTHTTREKYVLDSRLHGVHPNRRKAWVRKSDIVGLSKLEDVLVD